MYANDIDIRQLFGYRVVGPGGSFGTVHPETQLVDEDHIVIEQGWWVFKRRYLIPTPAVRSVDETACVVCVNDRHEDIPVLEYDPDRDASRSGPLVTGTSLPGS